MNKIFKILNAITILLYVIVVGCAKDIIPETLKREGIEIEITECGYDISLGGRFHNYQPFDRDMIELLKIKDKISELSIYTKNITNDGFKCLQEFKNLQYLILDGTNYNDESIKYIIHLSKLKYLDLSETKITSKSFEDIAKIKSLETLFLSRLKTFTDDDLNILAKAPNLDALTVSETNITFKCIHALMKMKKLKGINITKTRISVSEYHKIEEIFCKNKSTNNCDVVYLY